MKTRILSVWLCALSLVVLFSCNKENEPVDPGKQDPDGGKPAALTLAATPESVVLADVSADATALTFTWDGAGIYDLYINLASKADIYAGAACVEGVSGGNRTFTHEALNEIVLGCGAAAGTAVNIKALLYSEEAQSNEVVVTVTPFAARFVAPAAIYPIGGATPYIWALENSVAAYPKADDPNIFEIKDIALRLEGSDGNGLQLKFSKDGSDARTAVQDPAGAPGDIKIFAEDEGGLPEFFLGDNGYENGIYDITVNFNTMKLTISQKKADLPKTEPEKLYMLGDCFTWSWGWTGTTLDKVSDGIYRAEGVSMTFMARDDNEGKDIPKMGFKIFEAIEQWNPEYVMAEESTADNIQLIVNDGIGDKQIRPGRLGYENGIYDIEVDWNAMTMTLTKKDAVPEKTYPEKLYIFGGCLDGEWDVYHPLDRIEGGLYKANDINISCEYEGDGFKLVTTPYWSNPEYQMTADSSKGNIKLEVHDGDPDRQIQPLNLGYENGIYDIEVDWDAMTMTLTNK